MRTTIGPVVAAVLALCPAGARAEEPFRLSVDAGLSKPTGPSVFSDMWQVGVAVGVGAEQALTPVLRLWWRAGYERHALDEGSANGRFYTQGTPSGVSGGALSIWALQVGVRARAPSGTVRPYADLGATFETIRRNDIRVRYIYFVTNEEISYVAKGASESRPGLTVGTGFLYQARPSLAVFLDAHVEVLFTSSEVTHYVPIRMGVLFP